MKQLPKWIVAVTFFLLIAFTCNAFAGQLFWTESNTGKVYSADLDGSNVQDYTPADASNPRGIKVDYANGKVYWADESNGVYVADVNAPSSAQLFLQRGSVVDIAVDATDNTMFITHNWVGGSGALNAVDMTTKVVGPNIGHVNGLEYRNSIDIDPVNNKVYWVGEVDEGDTNIDHIGSANYDGSDMNPAVVQGEMFNTMDYLAIDSHNGRIYYSGWETSNKIRSANLDGTDEIDLITFSLQQYRYIALDPLGNKMYWTEYSLGEIWRANLDGSNPEAIITGLDSPRGLALNVPVPEPASLSLIFLTATAILYRRSR